MTTDLDARTVFAARCLNYVPPLIRETLLEDRDFREEYKVPTDTRIAFGESDVDFQRYELFNTIRVVLANPSMQRVADVNGKLWTLKDISEEGELPNLELSRGEQCVPLPAFAFLSPDKSVRLRLLEETISETNLPRNVSTFWRDVLENRALEDDEVDVFYRELRDTPAVKERDIRTAILAGQNTVSSLVPNSRDYYVRLVGAYDGSPSIREFAARIGIPLLDNLVEWHPYDGFLFSLYLSSHSSLTDAINVDRISRDDLVRAYSFLDEIGDRISQLGAIEVGMRILPTRPEIEQPLIRLIEQIRDDDVNGPVSGFKLLSALFCLVDGELSRIRLFCSEPPFYRRLAAMSHAALIQRQLADLDVNVEKFAEWAYLERGEPHYLQSLVDMRREPHWDPEFTAAHLAKAHFFGRIMTSGRKYVHDEEGSPVHMLVFGGGTSSLRFLGQYPQTLLPGPLEGTHEPGRILPSEVADAIETQISSREVRPASFYALVNFVSTHPISADHAQMAANALNRGGYRLQEVQCKSELFTILNRLATVAAVTRCPELGDALRILVRRYRKDPEFPISIDGDVKICLTSGSSHSDLTEWIGFVGEWLTELAYEDLEKEEGLVFHSILKRLCHCVPELWISCGRADAALQAFNGK